MNIDFGSLVNASFKDAWLAGLPELIKSERHRIREMLVSVLADQEPTPLEVTVRTATEVVGSVRLDLVHGKFPTLVRWAAAGLNVALVGEAGSGKTKAGSQLAVALGRTFALIPCNLQLTTSSIIGYNTADGTYIRTLFRDAFENGGVFLFDEFDACNPNSATIINALIALSSGEYGAFPDGMVKRHPDFLPIVAMNTYGKGADRVYVGRNILDGATMDRFVTIEWDYDRDLEAAIAHKLGISHGWVQHVWAVRDVVNELKIRHVVGTRSIIQGGTMLALGEELSKVERSALWKGLDADTVDKIKRAVTKVKKGESLGRSLPFSSPTNTVEYFTNFLTQQVMDVESKVGDAFTFSELCEVLDYPPMIPMVVLTNMNGHNYADEPFLLVHKDRDYGHYKMDSSDGNHLHENKLRFADEKEIALLASTLIKERGARLSWFPSSAQDSMARKYCNL